jgi:hypothetical protein
LFCFFSFVVFYFLAIHATKRFNLCFVSSKNSFKASLISPNVVRFLLHPRLFLVSFFQFCAIDQFMQWFLYFSVSLLALMRSNCLIVVCEPFGCPHREWLKDLLSRYLFTPHNILSAINTCLFSCRFFNSKFWIPASMVWSFQALLLLQ